MSAVTEKPGAVREGALRAGGGHVGGGGAEDHTGTRKEERQAETAPLWAPSAPSLPSARCLQPPAPASSCFLHPGPGHQEPLPHGLSHSQNLSFPPAGWHLPPQPHCTNPPALAPRRPPALPQPGTGSFACHRVRTVPLRGRLAGALVADGTFTMSSLLPFVLQ